MDRKIKIVNEIRKHGFPAKEVAVTLEEFFEGNNDDASIGVNLYPHQPSPQDFYDVFKRIKDSEKTENIFVRISDAEEGDWFYTDAVYVVGKWAPDELREVVRDLRPDEIYEGWMYGKPVNISQTNDKVLSLWWD
jgi:hypothetical protein